MLTSCSVVGGIFEPGASAGKHPQCPLLQSSLHWRVSSNASIILRAVDTRMIQIRTPPQRSLCAKITQLDQADLTNGTLGMEDP